MAKTNLTDFIKATSAPANQAEEENEMPEWVKLGTKVLFEDHLRLKHLAASKHIAVQRLNVRALNMLMDSDGLPPIKDYNERGP